MVSHKYTQLFYHSYTIVHKYLIVWVGILKIISYYSINYGKKTANRLEKKKLKIDCTY